MIIQVNELHFHAIDKFPHSQSYRLVVGHPRGPDFVSVLISAMRSKRTVSDVAHQLSLGSISVQEVEKVLCELLEALESNDYGLRGVWFHEFLGMLLEVYR